MTEPESRRWQVERVGPEAAAAMARIAASSLVAAWSAPAFAAELTARGGAGWLVRPAPAAAPVGQLLLHRVLDEVEIRSLAVLPAAQRRGAATALLAAALADAERAGVRRVHLEVRAGNAAARALYAGAGFVPTGCRPRYYSDGEAALLLTRAWEPPRQASALR